MKKNSFCKFFREGRCNKGEDCPFAHRDDELVQRDWPKFARLPGHASAAAQEDWAVQVLWIAAPFGSKDLSDIYPRARGLKAVLDGRGGFKKFCESFPDRLSFDGTVLRRAPGVPLSRVAELIRASVDRHGGCVRISELYEEHSGLEEALGEHRGPVAVCAKAFTSPPWLAVTHGQIRSVADVAPLPPVVPCRTDAAGQHAAAGLLYAIQEVARSLGHGASSAEAFVLGSSANGFADQSSDIDVVLKLPVATMEHFKGADGVLRAFERQIPVRGELVVAQSVFSCRVPILKLRRGKTECDLSCNNVLPLFNTALLATYATLEKRLVPLVLEVKSWARSQGIHGARDGYLSSYAFTLLVIFYAQRSGVLPCLQSDLEPTWWVERGRAFNVAMHRDRCHQEGTGLDIELSLTGFARYFSRHDVVWSEQVVSVRAGALLPAGECPHLKFLSDRQWDAALHIEDPFDETRNLSDMMGLEQFARFREQLSRAAA